MRTVDHYYLAAMASLVDHYGDGSRHPAHVLAEQASVIAEATVELVCDRHGHEMVRGRCDRCSFTASPPPPPPSTKPPPRRKR